MNRVESQAQTHTAINTMSRLTGRLKNDYDRALEQSVGIHANDIKIDFLPIFERAAREVPDSAEPVAVLFKNAMDVDRSNCAPALYSLMRLADVGLEGRSIVRSVLGDDLKYYQGDEDKRISVSALILEQILDGAVLADFQRGKQDTNMNQVSLQVNSPQNFSFIYGHQNSVGQNVGNHSKVKTGTATAGKSYSLIAGVFAVIGAVLKFIVG